MAIEHFTCLLIHETAAAYLVDDCGNECWIPKSQIEDEEIFQNQDGVDFISFGIPEWLAIEKGMV